MPRPTDMSMGAPDSFGPTASPTNNLNVVAPLDVTAAPTQAAALAKSLGIANEIAQPIVRKDAMMQGRKDAQQGQSDAQFGQINQDKYNQIEGYRVGAKRNLIQQYGNQYLSEAEQLASAPADKGGWAGLPAYDTTGPDGTVQKGLLSNMDGYLKDRMGDLVKDPEAANVLRPMVEKSMQLQAGQRIQQQMHDTLEQNLDTQSKIAVRSAMTGDGSFNFQQAVQDRAAMNGGNTVEAQQSMFNVALETAKTLKNESLLDSGGPLLPDKITLKDGQTVDGPAYSPRNVAAINEARQSIQSEIKRDSAFDDAKQKVTTMKPYYDVLAQGKTLDWNHLYNDAQQGKMSWPESLELWNKSLSNVGTATTSDYVQGIISSGKPWTTYVGQQIGDKRITKEDFENGLTDMISRLPKEQQPQMAATMSARTGLTYKPLQATMSYLNLNSPEGVKNVLDTYGTLKSQDQTVADLYFSDPARRDQVQTLQAMRESGQNDQQIADFMQHHDFKAAKENYDHFIYPRVQQALGDLTVDGRHPLDFQFSKVNVSDLTNGGAVLAKITQRAQMIGQQGMTADPAEIVNRASQAVINENYLVRLNDGRSMLLPRTKDDPPEAQAAVQDFYKSEMPTTLKAAGYKGDINDVRLAPDNNIPGALVMVDHTGYPAIPGQRYTMQKIAYSYLSRTHGQAVTDAQSAQADAQQHYLDASKANEEATQSLNIGLASQQAAPIQ